MVKRYKKRGPARRYKKKSYGRKPRGAARYKKRSYGRGRSSGLRYARLRSTFKNF